LGKHEAPESSSNEAGYSIQKRGFFMILIEDRVL